MKPTRSVVEDHCPYCQARRPHSLVENGRRLSYRCLRCSRRRRVTLAII